MVLKDSSKYGTFINGQRMTENTAVNLNSGDNVTFGVFESKFMLVPLNLLNSFMRTIDCHAFLNFLFLNYGHGFILVWNI